MERVKIFYLGVILSCIDSNLRFSNVIYHIQIIFLKVEILTLFMKLQDCTFYLEILSFYNHKIEFKIHIIFF